MLLYYFNIYLHKNNITTMRVLTNLISLYKKASLILGILVPSLCYCLIDDMDILSQPLSRFGIVDSTKNIWIVFNVLMSISLLLIGLNSNSYIRNVNNRFILNVLLVTATIAFAMSGIVNMNFNFLHFTLASIFFFSYIGYIYWYGVFNKKSIFTIYSIVIVSISIILLLITMYFNISYGLFECVNIIMIIIWNYKANKI